MIDNDIGDGPLLLISDTLKKEDRRYRQLSASESACMCAREEDWKRTNHCAWSELFDIPYWCMLKFCGASTAAAVCMSDT